jgi:diadenosine tetraphosphate (Ap4A) HIT family hydrolase
MSLFTKIIQGAIPSSKVASGESWYAFLDINPRRAGHTLVVPTEEKQRIVRRPAFKLGPIIGRANGPLPP